MYIYSTSPVYLWFLIVSIILCQNSYFTYQFLFHLSDFVIFYIRERFFSEIIYGFL